MNLQMRFGKRVRELRSKQDLSQEALAFKSGLHRTYIGGIELGKRNVSLLNLAKIAKALKLTLSEMLQGLP